jgi:AraC-like DNA-binding protein
MQQAVIEDRFDVPGNAQASVAERVITFVETNYAGRISLRDVAEALGYSPCHLTTTFRQATGMPVTAWIIRRRIVAAQRLLGEQNVSVAGACEAVGFSDLCYFTRQFVRHVGVTPGRFRAANGGGRALRASPLPEFPAKCSPLRRARLQV